MDLVATRTWAAERRPIRHLDPTLILAAVALSVAGLLMVYSATHGSLATLRLDPGYFVKKQATFLVLGLVLMVMVATFDYRFAKVYAGMMYVGMLALLVLVRTPLGATAKGAQRWFQVAGFQFAPSEYMKLALIIMLAAVLSEIRTQELSAPDVFRATAIAVVPILLVFIQPDIGTTIVLGAILVGTLVVAGARMRTLAALALVGLLLIFGAFRLGAIKQYQIDRLTAFFDPSSDSAQANWNKQQAEIAIGSGGLWGRGYLRGTQTNLKFVPEQHTDFVFTVVGEELGFAGSVVLLLLFGVLIWRAFRIALLSKDPFGTYVAAGIAAMFAIQIFVNIGMNLGIMPITGIPLPFLSYGGTSLLASFTAIGLLLNVHMRRFK